MKRSASAVWNGGLQTGKGAVSTGAGALKNVPYNFKMRFADEPGTNPEELIAAAHAACFSMALSAQLEKEGLSPDSIDTTATVTFEKVGDAFSVTESHLQTNVKSANADPAKFKTATDNAKNGCPISRLLAPGTKITMDAKLV